MGLWSHGRGQATEVVPVIRKSYRKGSEDSPLCTPERIGSQAARLEVRGQATAGAASRFEGKLSRSTTIGNRTLQWQFQVELEVEMMHKPKREVCIAVRTTPNNNNHIHVFKRKSDRVIPARVCVP